MRILVPLVLLFTTFSTTVSARNPSSVGAVGWIEPVSGLVSVGHDGGFEGVRVQEILVQVGDNIEQGQKLAVFSDFERRSAQVDVEATRKQILDEKLKLLETRYNYLNKKLKRSRKLVRSNTISEMDFEDLEYDVNNARHQIAEMATQIKHHETVLVLSQLELRRSFLVSPINGTVLSINTRPGERANEKPIMSLANLDSFEAVVEVAERNVIDLKPGQPAIIRTLEIDRVFQGEISNINRFINNTKLVSTDPVSARDRRVVEVRVKIDDPGDEILGRIINHKVRVFFQ